jgi:predicted MFS family arabinose efflux permease
MAISYPILVFARSGRDLRPMTDRGLLHHHDYLLLWTGSTVSGLGSQLSVLAYPLLVLAIGGNATQAGAVGTCSLITRLIFRLPGGHLTDRLNWRWLMICMDLVRLIAVGSVPLTGLLGVLAFPQLLAVAFAEGTATAFFQPSSTVAVRDVVPPDRLTEAFGMAQSRMAAIGLAGPVLGGALFGLGHTLPFTVDAASYAVSAISIISLRTRPARRAAGEKVDRRMTAGLRWLGKQPEVMRVLFFATVINFVGGAAETAVIIVLRESGTASGIIGAVLTCAGIGAVLGAVLAPRLLRLLRSRLLCLVTGALWALGLAGFALDSAPVVIAPLLVVLVLIAPALGIRLAEITVGRAPHELLGRVSTAESTVTAGLASVGPLLGGAAIQGFGGSRTFGVLAALCVLAAIIAAIPIRRAAASPVPDAGG